MNNKEVEIFKKKGWQLDLVLSIMVHRARNTKNRNTPNKNTLLGIQKIGIHR